MALIVKPNTFSAGEIIVAAEHNDNFDTLYDEINGQLSNVNISSTADIQGSKLLDDSITGAKLTDNTIEEENLSISNATAVGTFLKWKDNTDRLTWSDVDSSDLTGFDLSDTAAGAMLVYSGSNFVALPSGNNSQYLTTTGSGISWQDIPAVGDLGTWDNSRNVNTTYAAASAGFVCAHIDYNNVANQLTFNIVTDSSNPPTTIRQQILIGGAVMTAGDDFSLICPVRSGDYWKVNLSFGNEVNVFWIPLV